MNPVKTQQFILSFSTTCFGLKGHCQVEQENEKYVFAFCMELRSQTLTVYVAMIESIMFWLDLF